MEKYSLVRDREPGSTTNTGYDSHPPTTAAMKRDPGAPVNDTGWFSRMKQRHPFLGKKRGKALIILILLLPLLGLLGLLALRNRGASGLGDASGSAGTEGAISDDTYFYGQSEPVYPSREL